MRQAGEPTVEEILESIKKVIARDNRTEAAQARVRRDGAPGSQSASATGRPAMLADRASDILDLSEVAAQIMGADARTLPDSLTETLANSLDDESEAEAAAPLLPESTTASMRESLAALAVLSEPGAQPQIVRSGETSLEGLVREMLRPMLAEWLDKNLPPMVEKMVAGEIARIVGKKG